MAEKKNKSSKSIEEKIEDWCKDQLKDVKTFKKTESINQEIADALEKYPSKKGGDGGNYPDIKAFIEKARLPVMIEVKGTKGNFAYPEENNIENKKKDRSPNYKNISKYAVNGAIHYANAIVNLTESYKKVIAIGVNGYEEAGTIIKEIGVYYVSTENLCIPKKIDDYTDLSFLRPENIDDFLDKVEKINLTEEEKEKAIHDIEDQFEDKLKNLNQKMNDDLAISVGQRVGLIVGLIMAGLGAENVSPLDVAELKGESGNNSNDGAKIIAKIKDFLENKKLPQEKKEMIIRDLTNIIVSSDLWKSRNGESKLKIVYTDVKNDIIPLLKSKDKYLDFTGKLFNVLNEWVDIPDSEKNDVVLTPRYVTDFMAKLCEVNKDSYVWDYAVGTAGFLISSMKLMIKDVEEKIKSPEERKQKIAKLKYSQLLGIEKRADIYLLAVLNMILMGDGSSNILHEDSLYDFSGNYEQGKLKDKKFPATVFLLNPPYSAKGKGLVFVEKALSRMEKGKAAILIQENAGSKEGLPYTKRILEKNTLLASIHMADIFRGKSNVQTAIYIFDVGNPHKENKIVKFIDFSNDGYARQNRKNSKANVNLRNVDYADERYQEVIDIVLGCKKQTNYYDDLVVEDTITLEGNDWTYKQHQKIDTTPTEQDFKNTVKDYLAWKVSQVLKGDTEYSDFQ